MSSIYFDLHRFVVTFYVYRLIAHIGFDIVATALLLSLERSLCFWASRAFKVACLERSKHVISQTKTLVIQTTHCPVAALTPPPSEAGISRLSPAPDAAEPTVTELPRNLFVAAVSTPDSFASEISHCYQITGNGSTGLEEAYRCRYEWRRRALRHEN